jgi:glutaredoxin
MIKSANGDRCGQVTMEWLDMAVGLSYKAFSKIRLRRALPLASSLLGLTLFSGCSGLPNSYEMRLAEHLSATNAKMYGAYWCPHCAVQKDYFQAAAEQLPYVECDPQGYNAQPEACAALGIEAYPTWVINGEYYQGAQLPGKLAALSGFEAASFESGTDASAESSAGDSVESETEDSAIDSANDETGNAAGYETEDSTGN